MGRCFEPAADPRLTDSTPAITADGHDYYYYMRSDRLATTPVGRGMEDYSRITENPHRVRNTYSATQPRHRSVDYPAHLGKGAGSPR